MTTDPKNITVLFLCVHNSARSLMAEAALNYLGGGRFKAYSAGSDPDEHPHPFALKALGLAGIHADELQCKSWSEFAKSDAPHMDLVVTVCDNVNDQVCPHWPGHPATAHWSYPDPSLVKGADEDVLHAFVQTLHQIHQQLANFIALPESALNKLTIDQSARDAE